MAGDDMTAQDRAELDAALPSSSAPTPSVASSNCPAPNTLAGVTPPASLAIEAMTESLDGMQEMLTKAPQRLKLDRLTPHPNNPRIAPRMDVVDPIASRLRIDGFDPAHALIVRPLGDGWQILSGHHRALAAAKARLKEVPCWVRPLDDRAAYMVLLTANTQGELTPIERGRHALKSGLNVKAYAKKVGRAHTTVHDEVKAARVAEASDTDIRIDGSFSQLVAIHAAPEWMWRALVKKMVEGEWTVEQTRGEIAWIGVKDKDKDALLSSYPHLDIAGAAEALVSGKINANVARATRPRLVATGQPLSEPKTRPSSVSIAGASSDDQPVLMDVEIEEPSPRGVEGEIISATPPREIVRETIEIVGCLLRIADKADQYDAVVFINSVRADSQGQRILDAVSFVADVVRNDLARAGLLNPLRRDD